MKNLITMSFIQSMLKRITETQSIIYGNNFKKMDGKGAVLLSQKYPFVHIIKVKYIRYISLLNTVCQEWAVI